MPAPSYKDKLKSLSLTPRKTPSKTRADIHDNHIVKVRETDTTQDVKVMMGAIPSSRKEICG